MRDEHDTPRLTRLPEHAYPPHPMRVRQGGRAGAARSARMRPLDAATVRTNSPAPRSPRALAPLQARVGRPLPGAASEGAHA